MAAPVNQSPIQSGAQAVETPRERLVPAGLGSAPTTIESRQSENNSKPVTKLGYVETVVLFIRDVIVWVFRKLFCCFITNIPPPAPQNSQQPAAPTVPAPSPPAAPQLPMDEAPATPPSAESSHSSNGSISGSSSPSQSAETSLSGPSDSQSAEASLGEGQEISEPPSGEENGQPLATSSASESKMGALKASDGDVLNRLNLTLLPSEIKQLFQKHFSDDERSDIYFELGKTQSLSLAQGFFHSSIYSEDSIRAKRIQMGKQMVDRNPALHLLPHLMQKFSNRIQ